MRIQMLILGFEGLRLKSKLSMKGKHHSKPSIKKDFLRYMNMVTQPQSFTRVGVSTAVEKAWMN